MSEKANRQSQYSISSLLMATAFVAITVTVCQSIDRKCREDILLLLTAVVSAAAPVLAAWLTARICASLKADSHSLRMSIVGYMAFFTCFSWGVAVICVRNVQYMI